MTGHALVIERDVCRVATEHTRAHYYYDNLSSLVLYDNWSNNLILEITPHKGLTEDEYMEDTFHLADIEPSCVQLEGYVLANTLED